MKKRIFLIIGIFFLIISLFSFLYPYLSNFINSLYSNSEIENYSKNINVLADSEKQNYYAEAERYNSELKNKVANFTFSSESIIDSYNDVLNFNDGIMAYIKIPKIDVNLPIYHGLNESVLSKGAVHIPNTAFPIGSIGGKGNNTVISAHTAYPTQVFFDNLKDLTVGDYVYISVLGDTFTYRVCDINIVEPTDIELLQPDKDRNLLSLVTCYPYAVNSHRLIVTTEYVSMTDDTSAQDTVTVSNSPQSLKSNSLLFIIFTAIFITTTTVTVFVVIKKVKKGSKKNA